MSILDKKQMTEEDSHDGMYPERNILKDFPLFCPKCKLTHIIDVEKLEIVIKNTEKQTFII